jgi:hypothetical protein
LTASSESAPIAAGGNPNFGFDGLGSESEAQRRADLEVPCPEECSLVVFCSAPVARLLLFMATDCAVVLVFKKPANK